MNAYDEPGLGLFDDAASAAGNFPTALRGYERTAVDDYVRSLEANVVQSRQHLQLLAEQVTELQIALSQAQLAAVPVDDVTRVGGRTHEILQLAEEQSEEMVQRATVEADQIKEAARRESEELRRHAAREGADLRGQGVAEIERLRVRLAEDTATAVGTAQAEAVAIVAAARRQAETLRAAAEHDAQSIRQAAHLDAEQERLTAERETAATREQILLDRDATLTAIRTRQAEHQEMLSALLVEATEHNQASAERLEADIAEAARIRTEAVAEADRIRTSAVTEADKLVSDAKREAAETQTRTQQEFAWRRQQLKRETELLGRRKQAVLHQLANLSALASETASSFPEVEEPRSERDETRDDTVVGPASAASTADGGSSAADAGEDSPEDTEDTEDTAVLVAAGDDDPGRSRT